jgi:hypothetical protein
MTKEEKQLLLVDLCARLPYGVKIELTWWVMDEGTYINTTLEPDHIEQLLNDEDGDTEIKPYLRPISSMTDEEVDNLFRILKINEENANEWIKVNEIGIIRLFTEEGKDFYEIAEAMDYLHSIHIDYRSLIPKGLAIEVTEENNPYK